MVVNGEKINFPGGGTHFHDGADKYILALARVCDENICLHFHFLCNHLLIFLIVNLMPNCLHHCFCIDA